MQRIDVLRILLHTENNLQLLKLNIEILRALSSELMLEVYVADNASTDGTMEWLTQQEDLSFICFDEGKVGFAKVLNESLDAFGLYENVLILHPRYFLQSESAERILDFVNELVDNHGIMNGMVGFLSNGFRGDQNIKLNGYDESGDYMISRFSDKNFYFRELGIAASAFYLLGNIYQDIGKFSEDFNSGVRCMEDYYLRCIQKEVPIVVPTAPIAFYDVLNGAPFEIEDDEFSRDLLRKKWGMNYFNFGGNEHIVNLVLDDNNRALNILEIGCDKAATLLAIKNRLPLAEIYGVEISEGAASIAAHFAKVECCDINVNFPFSDVKFDYIIFGDVLEHLPDPQKTLKICKEHLCEGGCILASIPNVMHISVMKDLLKGNFTYTDIGLLDKTHIHMFTYNEILKMFANVGLELVSIQNAIVPITEQDRALIEKLLQIEPEAQAFMYETFQYLVKARM